MADFSPNPFGNFDPSQWSNPYSLYRNQALPWPSSYVGTPTDAMGRPIASYQAPQPAAAAPPPGVSLASNPMTFARAQSLAGDMMGAAPQMGGGFGAQAQLSQAQDSYGSRLANVTRYLQGQASPFSQQPAAAAAAPAPAAPNNWDAALSALANPGPVVTPGATVPQAPTGYQPGPGVLQQFLANWSPASSGPGAGFQQVFAKALKGGKQ